MNTNPINLSNSDLIEQHIEEILKLIGDNPDRTGLKDTPRRVAKMYKETFRGYDPEQKPVITVFPNNDDGIKYNQMIGDKGYFYSHCEHHMVPFFGEYYFAYIPNKKIVGISKIARLVDYYSAKLQVQERLTIEIVNELERLLKPKGIALVMKARHLCKEMRGVKKHNVGMITSEMRGVFLKNASARAEFLNLTKDN